MDLLEAINKRHSVRSYTDKKIEGEIKAKLLAFIDECNRESELSNTLVLNDGEAFNSMMAHYGSFKNVKNYIVMKGKKSDNLEELCGYYGEKIVLYAQTLGLNTCWVALTYKKSKTKVELKSDEKLVLIIAIGYGESEGKAHKSKPIEKVTKVNDGPDWFKRGIEAALLAPTALNQQKFNFSLKGNEVTCRAGLGFYTKIDLGIVKYHFEIGAGIDNFIWN